jgi:hypothetical protein
MKGVFVALAVFALAFSLGCLGDKQSVYSIINASDGLSEYRSSVHGGYSFLFNSTFAFDAESSYDSSLLTSLVFACNSSGYDCGVLIVGVVPDLITQGIWLNEACDREKLAVNLKSQRDLNVTEIKSITDRKFKNSMSCIAEVSSMQGGVEIPLAISFAECKNKTPFYVTSAGASPLSDVELILGSFDC